MELSEVVAIASSILTAAGGAGAVARASWREFNKLRRTVAALESAVELHDAQNRGVVLLIAVQGVDRPCRARLEAGGWVVCPKEISDQHPLALWDQKFREDLAAADVVVLDGLPAEKVAELAASRMFRDGLGAGAAVVAYGRKGVFYDLALWGPEFTTTTNEFRTALDVRGAVAERRILQRLQGVRPGQLAAAKAALQAS